MRPETKRSVRTYLLELVVYSGLVAAYFFLVLHFLGGWLYHLFHDERGVYAWVALGLIVGQGILLDLLTRLLLGLFRRTEEE